MKFSLVPVALLAAFAASGAVAQDSSAASGSMSGSMSASMSGSMSSSASGSMPTSMASSAGGAGGAGGAMVCTALGGDPRAQPAGCPYSSTTTPAYDLSSLISYFIGGYTRGPEAKSPDEVANEMAGSVLQYYPTLTTPRGDLQKEFASAISATINAIAGGKLKASDLAPASRNFPEHALKYGAAAAAIVAAGAFAL